GGQMLKEIVTAARLQIEKMLEKRVFLELFVKVRENWRESREVVEELDWRRQVERLAIADKSLAGFTWLESGDTCRIPGRRIASNKAVRLLSTRKQAMTDNHEIQKFETGKLKLKVTLAADRNAVDPVVQSVMDVVRQVHCDAEKYDAIELALTEALANA